MKTKRDFSRLEWQKLRERKEALDCLVYARAAAWIAGADRWTEAMWSGPGTAGRRVPGELENEQEKELDTKPTSIAGVLGRQPERRSRRVFRSSYAKASENLEEDLAMQYVAMCHFRT